MKINDITLGFPLISFGAAEKSFPAMFAPAADE